MFLAAFLIVTALLWISLFGYPVLLLILALFSRSRTKSPPERTPSVAVIVPTLNEEKYVCLKLADLQKTSYPMELISFYLVDGGSSDRTVELAEFEAAAFPSLHVVSVRGSKGKSDQINRIVPNLEEEILVVTDVDTRLHSECIRELVNLLEEDPELGVAGATVIPETELLEEKIHWVLQNQLWWLEGQALESSSVCAACYAVRTSVFAELPLDAVAEDIHLALSVGQSGYGSRTSRDAVATELRVPRTLRSFIEFRKRRGSDYSKELKRLGGSPVPVRWKMMSLFRRWLFSSLPALLLFWVAFGGAVMFQGDWNWVVGAVGLFGSSTLCSLGFFYEDLKSEHPSSVAVSLVRFLILIWLSLLWIKVMSLCGEPNATEEPSEYDIAIS